MSSYKTPNAIRFARVRKCFSDCGRSPASPRVPHGSPQWQPAYNHCIRNCSQSGGEYMPYSIPASAPRRGISENCARQMQYEAMGESPEDIKRQLGFYDPNCEGAWQYSKFAGSKKRGSRKKLIKTIEALSTKSISTLKKRRR